MRGKRRRTRWGVCGRGLIPARAGKTLLDVHPTRLGAAHPRACGENPTGNCSTCEYCGSSPRVRGKHKSKNGKIDLLGLIPARAGKTLVMKVLRIILRAHPRACGENWGGSLLGAGGGGSSPRVRGKPVREVPGFRVLRLIPARAGKTDVKGGGESRRPAHPRACGENISQRSA
ncbi:hypothetical protein HMPREF1550_00921 [Actinomyces sp. oral taxon 877 str. F0543]|nr:hypothetical protein HMPREF1550_00921 [Actinomyces sp. oral taxon 877 str. F0543]